MKYSARKYTFLLIFLLPAASLYPDQLNLNFTVGQNYGEYIEETGQKTPSNLQGLSGGSRITYPRDFKTWGIGLDWFYNKFEILTSLNTTAGKVVTGEGRDEDFFLDPIISTARGSKISLMDGEFYDTAYTFTGLRNYADAKGTMRLQEFGARFKGRYYFNESPQENGGFFVSIGYNYTYSYYLFENIVQYVDLPSTGKQLYAIPGRALTLTVNSHEYLFGAGYRFQKEKWFMEFSFMPLLSTTEARDRHNLRFMNFFIQSYGSGLLFSTKYSQEIIETIFMAVEIFEHRNYQKGVVQARGGVTREDLFANYVGSGRIYMNNKESGFLLSVTKRFNY